MSDTDRVYESLAEHLNKMPAGFPSTPEGVELRILRRLFTPDEAALAQLVTLRPERAEGIAARCGQDPVEMAVKLESMARKGLIFRIHKGEEVRYMAAQFVIGIWEYHVNDLDPDLIRDVNEYLPYFFHPDRRGSTPQLRTIPISRALSPDQAVMPYERAREILGEQDLMVVAPCICRKEHAIMGKGCGGPLESCLVFGAAAQYYLDNGLGRIIDRGEALEILDGAETHGLVLQPSNAQKVVNICTCCGCCCQILKNLKAIPNPARYVASNYYAAMSGDQCAGCETCLERCPMEAIAMMEGVAEVDRERCIGCGLCVPSCSEGAIELRVKPEEERTTPPASFSETMQLVARERVERLKKRRSS